MGQLHTGMLICFLEIEFDALNSRWTREASEAEANILTLTPIKAEEL